MAIHSITTRPPNAGVTVAGHGSVATIAMLDALSFRVDGLSGRCQALEDENLRLRNDNKGQWHAANVGVIETPSP